MIRYVSFTAKCLKGTDPRRESWLWEKTRVQEVMGLNLSTGGWINIFSH